MERIVLNEQNFTDLVQGKVVEKEGCEIILQDIGHETMYHIIYAEMYRNKELVRTDAKDEMRSQLASRQHDIRHCSRCRRAVISRRDATSPTRCSGCQVAYKYSLPPIISNVCL